MNIKVCYNCPLRLTAALGRITPKRCMILQQKLDGVRGMGLTAIDFECQTKLALFRPGQSVQFGGYEMDDYGNSHLTAFDGFVMGWVGRKVRVVSEQTDKPICHIYPNRLMPGDEPSRPVCIHCGMPQGIRIDIKSKYDDKPHPWVCRWDYQPDVGLDGIALPCEYGHGEDGK